MAILIARLSPVRVDDRTAELAGRKARRGESSKPDKVVVKADGLECAPAASGSGLRAIVVDCGGELLHRLQLRQVVCNQGESARSESTQGGYGAGRCIGHGSTNAVSSSQKMVTADRVSAHT